MDTQLTADLVKWAFQQGALSLLIVVVLWFYRRDWQRLADTWQVQTRELTMLINQTNNIISANTTAVQVQSQSMDQLSDALQEIKVVVRTDARRLP